MCPVTDAISWIASGATMVAAMMTAANLGTRLTGWGFVVFTIGSLAWATVGMQSDQTGLLVTNCFLFFVNLFGVWRWLGRQAAYEQGSAAAEQRSADHPQLPTLFSGASLAGTAVVTRDGGEAGHIVDAMFARDGNALEYVVLRRGGVGGAGETLHAVAGSHFVFSRDAARCDLTAAEIADIPPIADREWPEAAPSPQTERTPRWHAR